MHCRLIKVFRTRAESTTYELESLKMLTITKSKEFVLYPERIRYGFDAMSVGDSLLILDQKKAESARISAIQFSKRKQLGWRFSMRKMTDGWRLFRIE